MESLELRTNVIAAYVCGGHGDQVPEVAAAMQISPGDSSDVGFNMACALLQLRAFGDGEQQLRLALRAGAASGTEKPNMPCQVLSGPVRLGALLNEDVASHSFLDAKEQLRLAVWAVEDLPVPVQASHDERRRRSWPKMTCNQCSMLKTLLRNRPHVLGVWENNLICLVQWSG